MFCYEADVIIEIYWQVYVYTLKLSNTACEPLVSNYYEIHAFN